MSNNNNKFVIEAYKNRKYFKNASYTSWDFTEDISLADSFSTIEEANDMRDTLNRAIGSTYWDYSDILPEPRVVELNK